MLQQIQLAVLAAVTLVACNTPEKESAPPPTPSHAPAAPARPAPIDGGLQAQMRDHFESIRSVERAVVFGDVNAAKRAAAALANHQSAQDIENYSDEIESVRLAAAKIATGESLGAMAGDVAVLASRCGHCHLITSSITSFEWTEPPVRNDTGSQRMQRHQWAMERLWEGLVGPSQQSWQAGAAVLAADPMPASMLALRGMPEDVAAAKLAALQELAAKAQTINLLAERAELYGELLVTCSGCHVEAGLAK